MDYGSLTDWTPNQVSFKRNGGRLMAKPAVNQFFGRGQRPAASDHRVRCLFHFELNIGEIPDAVPPNARPGGIRVSGPTTHTVLASVSQPRSNPAGAGYSLVLAGGRARESVEFDRQVVDFFVSAADLLGVPKSVAAIYGIVFASPLPLSFAGIEERLDISKGSISQGLRVLREVGALKEVSSTADRAELFTPDLELRKLVARFIENRLQKQLDVGSSRLVALGKVIPGVDAEAAELKKRLKSLSDWHSKARTVLPLARTILKVGG